ncbi:MAG: glycosyltransferase family 4 protein [Patescibacteria group bacterium]
MRIVHLSCVLPPYGSGIGRVAAAYARILASEHQVTIFTPYYSDGRRPAEINNVKIEQLKPLIKSGNAAYLPNLNGQLKDFDVVHLHYPFFGVHEQLALNKLKKLIISYHMVPQADGLKGWWFKLDTAWTEKRLVPKARLWLVSSQDYADQVVGPRLGRSATIEVLPFGVAEIFKTGPKPKELRTRLGLSDADQVVLFVGGLDKAHFFKGVSTLLRAAQTLSVANFKLVIVGGGELLIFYRHQAEQLGLSNKVIFTGQVSEEELSEYYRLADIFVLPSINQAEAFGLVILEAMASGLPVIASNLTGVRTLVEPGKTGLLTEPGDHLSLTQALETLLNNDNQAKNMGKRAAEIVNTNYRWTIIGQKLLKLYQEL